MRPIRTTLLLPWMGAIFLLVAGCAGDDDAPSAPSPGADAVVTGQVTEVQNYVPSDGGVIITITSQVGSTEHLLFPSLFTQPPPTEETMRLYDIVRQVEVGDLVRADGTRTASGIALQSLMILPARL